MIEAPWSGIVEILENTPSMHTKIDEPCKLQSMLAHALAQAGTETERDCVPTERPWAMTDVQSEGWLPA